MNDELLRKLRYKSEGTDIDFKQAQYRFVGGSENEKGELLKDVLAIANAWREGPGYIVVGFKDQRPHPAEVMGITDHLDDAQLQQFINSKVKPKLTFQYEECIFEGKTVGIIAIPKQKRPFYLGNPYGKLKSNVVYVRRGSSTDEAEPPEVTQMVQSDSGREVKVSLSVLNPENVEVPAVQPLTYLHFTEEFPDSPPLQTSFLAVAALPNNRHFRREYGEYIRVHDALVQVKFVLRNSSGIQLSNAKLEVTVEALSGQAVTMIAGKDLPAIPERQWNFRRVGSLSETLSRQNPKLLVDCGGPEPVCHVRFGDLLPGETGGSSDTLGIVPAQPGKLRLRFIIRAAELAEPIEQERVIETTGAVKELDFEGFKAYVAPRLASTSPSEE